jgi:hypothetical protein
MKSKQLLVGARITIGILLGTLLLPGVIPATDGSAYCYKNQFPDAGPSKVLKSCLVDGEVCTGTCTKIVPNIPPGTVCEECLSGSPFKNCYANTDTSVTAVTYTAGCTWTSAWPLSSCDCGTYGTIGTPPAAVACHHVKHGTQKTVDKSDACSW